MPPLRTVADHPLHQPILSWYAQAARDLPWRRPGASPWAVLVSEVMFQQTPVARVVPVHQAWLTRWPTPPDLAAEPAGEAVRGWGRLGYPRRALRLHEAATAISIRHGGAVPDDLDALQDLPGIGAYTAAAVASFAFGQRHAVLDTNVRRVQARVVSGLARAGATVSRAENRLAHELLPDDPATAARWAVAVMELGALVCQARVPRCDACPVRDRCAWRRGGAPAHAGPVRPAQSYAGTDRQVRGLLLEVLRSANGPVRRTALELVWSEPVQRQRALDGLVADGLVEPVEPGAPTESGGFRLPGG